MQPQLPPIEAVVRGNVFGWWTVVAWTFFALSVLIRHVIGFELDLLSAAWWLAAISGIAAGVQALRMRKSALRLAFFASLVLTIASASIWWEVVSNFVSAQPGATAAETARQILGMISLSFGSIGNRGAWPLVIATAYRELIMPVLQLLTLIGAIGILLLGKR